MTTIAVPVRTAPRSSIPARVGVVLASLQGIGCIWLGISQFSPDGFGFAVSTTCLLAGVAALAFAVPIWRGVRWAAVVVGVLLVLESLTGLPAFFFPGIPAGWQIAAAVGIVVAIVTLILLLVPAKR